MSNYKSYRAYSGMYTRHNDTVDDVLRGINERDEIIISVTPVAQDNIYVLIITEERVGLNAVLEGDDIRVRK